MAQAQAELELVKSDQECQGIHPETLPIGSAEDAQRTHMGHCSSKPSGSQLVKFCLRADYFLTWRIGARSSYEERVFHPGLLPAWGAGAMERHCHSLAGMAPL